MVMKIEKFNEAKKNSDPNVGLTSMKIEVEFLVRVSKSANQEGYSLRVGIKGSNDVGLNGPTTLLGQGLTIEELEKERDEYLARISEFHKDANKYNL
jgi:hypothetical protein